MEFEHSGWVSAEGAVDHIRRHGRKVGKKGVTGHGCDIKYDALGRAKFNCHLVRSDRKR